MNRRTVLAGAGITLSLPLTGCLSDEENNSEGQTSEHGTPSVEDSKTIEEDPRVDAPSHEITPPADEDSDDWNDDYLGEHMETEPSVVFEELPISRFALKAQDKRLSDPTRGNDEFWVDVLESEDDRDTILDIEDETISTAERDQLKSIDFDESVLIVVETGYGSSSVTHRWSRVEDAGDSLHLHGYYTDPHGRDGDVSTRASVLEVERPSDELNLARVSLTVEEDRRVHFNSTEGPVSIDASSDESETLDCDLEYRQEQGKADAVETSVSNADGSCGFEAASAAVQHIESQLDTEFNSSWGGPSYSAVSEEARVELRAIKNRDGDYSTCPPLTFDEVVEVTPTKVTVTVEVENGEDEECTHNIYVNQVTEQED
ncbi:hypothetical protein [Natronosalvus vescus]|uniref:hypothetical protein n=1 Tax=Natronosalvus vescus TaxID=2953881 RepID=UPI00209168A9|nr:hypothetical protein [Natronosalvus vescus]